MSLSAIAADDFARTLTESLPYTQRFTDKTWVIKFGAIQQGLIVRTSSMVESRISPCWTFSAPRELAR